MARSTLATGLLLAMLTMGCGGAPAATPAEPAAASGPADTPVAPQQESVDALRQQISEAVDQFREDVANNAVRLFQHTVWVLMDENKIKDQLAQYDIELVGDVIVGKDHPSAGFDIWGVESPPMSGGQAYVAIAEDNLVVAFRSTASDDGWELTLNVLTDLRAKPRKIGFIDDSVSNAKEYRKLKVHSGFHNEYLRYRDRIREYVARHPDKDIYVTGHSLGGALAMLSSFDIAVHTQRPVTVFTFGQPRVGKGKFRDVYDSLVPNSYRVVVDRDPIPRVPRMLLNYEHVGKLLQLNPDGTQLAPEEIQSSAIFKALDLPKHIIGSYYTTILGLQTSCAAAFSLAPAERTDQWLNVGWLTGSADAERDAAKKARELVPEGAIPWEALNFDEIPIGKIPVDKIPTAFPAIRTPPWSKMAAVNNILIDKIPIDKIPVDKLPTDKLSFDKFSKKAPKNPFKKDK